MARIETWTCTNCWAEEDAPDWDVDERTGEYYCTDCKAQGMDSPQARARRARNREGAFVKADRIMSALGHRGMDISPPLITKKLAAKPGRKKKR